MRSIKKTIAISRLVAHFSYDGPDFEREADGEIARMMWQLRK